MTLGNQLNHLEASGLIRLATTQPEMEYLFRHVLLQEAAYNSTLKTERRSLHRAVGEALERLYPDQLASQELAPLLGQHFHEAGDQARALKYFALAGDAAARVYANAEAVLHYTHALHLARQTQPDNAQWIHLYAGCGQALELSSRYTEALANYKDMEAMSQAQHDPAMEFTALMAQAKIHSTANPEQDPAQAHRLLERALALAHARGDQEGESKILWNLMLLEIFAGSNAPQAIVYGEQALALARALGLREQLAFTLNDITYPYITTNQIARARAAQNEARELWRALDNPVMLADNLANTAVRRIFDGDYTQALIFTEEALRITQGIENVWGQVNSQFFLGHVYLERGQFGEALAIMERAIALGEQTGHRPALIGARADLAWAYGTLGVPQRGLALAQLALTNAEAHYPFWQPWPLAVLAHLHVLMGNFAAAEKMVEAGHQSLKPGSLQLIGPTLLAVAEGELALAQGKHSDGLAVMNELLAYLHAGEMHLFLPDALHLKSQALLALEDVEVAYETLGQARAEAESLGSRRSLWPILLMQSDLELKRGHPTEAEQLRRQAQEIITYMAEHIDQPDLRAAFLNRAEVQSVMRAAGWGDTGLRAG
jgi:tetratricopeptide (TPR) repeat protein